MTRIYGTSHDLWNFPRFVEEVEQVRRALGLSSENFYLYGHSSGGALATEYALKYQEYLKGLILSNTMASIPKYDAYAEEVLMPTMDQTALAEIMQYEAAEDYGNPRYQELLMEHYYVHHVLRMPPDEWPEPVNRSLRHLNPDIYVLLQGPSELGAGGLLADWDREADLERIRVPILVIGARYDTMDPEYLEWMASQVQRGRYLHCPEGSHFAMYDNQQTYFEGLIDFIKDVDRGDFGGG